MKKLIVLLLVSVYTYAGNEAMFGLNFGQTPKEIRALGTTLILKNANNNLSSYSCTSLPKNTSSAESYTLIFSNDSLVKIIMIGVDIVNDVYGNEGKEVFMNTLELLKKKYTLDLFRTDLGLTLYNELDEFYQCLAYDGCGLYAATLKNNTKNISLQLKGLERGKGYLLLTIEAEPEFTIALEKSKNITNKGDLEAF